MNKALAIRICMSCILLYTKYLYLRNSGDWVNFLGGVFFTYGPIIGKTGELSLGRKWYR